MSRNGRLLGIVLVGVAFLLPVNADATCSTSVSFGAYYSRIVGMSTYQSLRANFWVLDQGDPTVGLGVDNGSVIEHYAWINDIGLGYVYLLGNWDSAPYDGCPNSLPDGGATSSMVVSLSDVNGAGNMTYAVVCATRSGQRFLDYDMDIPPGCEFSSTCAPFNMVVAPKATIVNVVPANGTNDVFITVAPPSFAAGFYSDGSPNCTAANAIPLYDVYKQQTARDAPPNPSLDAGPWVLAATCNIDRSCTLQFTSPTNTDIYLAVSPHFNSNFTTGEAATGAPARVGRKSTRVQAGPILAVSPKRKTIPNPTGEESVADFTRESFAVLSEEVTLCHVPPGNPAGGQTIVVRESWGAFSVRAHLAHGDYLGACHSAYPVPEFDVYLYLNQGEP